MLKDLRRPITMGLVASALIMKRAKRLMEVMSLTVMWGKRTREDPSQMRIITGPGTSQGVNNQSEERAGLPTVWRSCKEPRNREAQGCIRA